MTAIIVFSLLFILAALAGVILRYHSRIPDGYSFWYEYKPGNQTSDLQADVELAPLKHDELMVWPKA